MGIKAAIVSALLTTSACTPSYTDPEASRTYKPATVAEDERRGGGFWSIRWGSPVGVVQRRIQGVACEGQACRGLVTLEGVPVKVTVELSPSQTVEGFELEFPPPSWRFVLKALRDTYGPGNKVVADTDIWDLPLGKVVLYATRATITPGAK